MFKAQPSPCKTYFINLPLSRLHIMETGEGKPLMMVPASISELENWRTLAQFMAQWFRVYFFELSGHGESEPFIGGFSSRKVAEIGRYNTPCYFAMSVHDPLPPPSRNNRVDPAGPFHKSQHCAA